jgi:hypothetical protein
MFKRLGHVLALACAIQAFSMGTGSQSEAKDLTDVLVRGFSFNAFGKDTTLAARAAAPAFSASIAEAIRQVPVASGAPSFIYRFNPALDTFERLSGVPGPLFTERALTLGKGQFDLSVGYSFIDFSDLNGTDLDNIRSPALLGAVFIDEGVPFRQPSLPGVELGPGEELFSAPTSLSLIRTQIDLQAHVIVPTLRYGLTNNWEVGLSIPIVNTFLRAKNEIAQIVDLDPASASFLFVGDTQGNFLRRLGFFDRAGNLLQREALPFIKSQRPPVPLSKAAGSATGVGDITLRTKYHFWRSELGGAAFGLNLQLPSGEVRNFHGTDETHLSTFLYVSQVFGKRFEPRFNIGVDFNANDVDRSSFLWSVGGTLLLGTQLGLIIDFMGRSEFGRFQAHIPPEGIYQGAVLNGAPNTCTAEQPCFIDTARGPVPFPFFPEKIKRNDKVDFAFGLRYALWNLGTIFFGGIVPMNDDGLRADFIPSGGFEYAF